MFPSSHLGQERFQVNHIYIDIFQLVSHYLASDLITADMSREFKNRVCSSIIHKRELTIKTMAYTDFIDVVKAS